MLIHTNDHIRMSAIPKQLVMTLLLCLATWTAGAQQATTTPPAVYHPEADAAAQLKAAVQKAGKSKKHVMVFVGGNWCVWCMRLDRFLQENDSLQNLLQQYEIVHVNYSKENKNEQVLQQLQHPERFGFPVMVILNERGKPIMTQDSGLLEEGKGYSTEKITRFLQNWTYNSINRR